LNLRTRRTVPYFLSLSFIVSARLVASPAGQSDARDSLSVSHLLSEGNEYAERLFDNQRALAKYLDALALDPKNDEVLWRISRTYTDIGEHLPTETDEDQTQQLQTYERALEYADKAIAANPASSMGFTRRAVAKSRIAIFRGVFEASDLVQEARDDLQKAVELDPQNSAAYHMLGRTHAKVSERPWIFRWVLGLGWASLEDAITHYERAIALRPDFIMYRLDCARALFELDEYAKAREQLQIIETLPTNDEDDDVFRQESKALLEKIREEEE